MPRLLRLSLIVSLLGGCSFGASDGVSTRAASLVWRQGTSDACPRLVAPIGALLDDGATPVLVANSGVLVGEAGEFFSLRSHPPTTPGVVAAGWLGIPSRSEESGSRWLGVIVVSTSGERRQELVVERNAALRSTPMMPVAASSLIQTAGHPATARTPADGFFIPELLTVMTREERQRVISPTAVGQLARGECQSVECFEQPDFVDADGGSLTAFSVGTSESGVTCVVGRSSSHEASRVFCGECGQVRPCRLESSDVTVADGSRVTSTLGRSFAILAVGLGVVDIIRVNADGRPGRTTTVDMTGAIIDGWRVTGLGAPFLTSDETIRLFARLSRGDARRYGFVAFSREGRPDRQWDIGGADAVVVPMVDAERERLLMLREVQGSCELTLYRERSSAAAR